MEKKLCCIFGAGDYFGDEKVPSGAFVIAADAGIKSCEKNNIIPDMIIGDFDSLGQTLQGENVITLPTVKDDTDTMAAVKYALKQGYRSFVLFGGTGGRLSHTVANLQTLTYIAAHGGTGRLHDKEEIATVTSESIAFPAEAVGFISVFAADGRTVISESGLKYTVEHAEITGAFPLGVSNEFIGIPSRITVHEGMALVITEKQKKG